MQSLFFFCTIGSPCDTKVGLERRTIVFKHAIQVLNDGDVSNKVLIYHKIVLCFA